MMPTGGEGYWNSMLGGYATSRYGEEAFEHFEQRHHGHITLILSLCYYLASSIWKDLLFMELPMKRKLSVDFACRQKVAIIGHFRLSFLKEADFAQKGSSFKD
jgi:hypothetical protein